MKENREKTNQKERGLWPAVALLLGVLALLTGLNVFFGDHWLDSDMAAEMVFSRLLAREGRLIATPDWYYSTEFRVLYTQLIMTPLFHVFSDWHLIRCLTNLITYLLMIAAYLYFTKPLELKKSLRLYTCVLLLLPFSETLVTHMQLGNTYMPHVILILFVFGMFLRLSGRRFSLRQTPLLGGYLLLCLVCGLSGVRYLLALQAPLVLASLVYLAGSREFRLFREKPGRQQAERLFSGERLAYLAYSLAGALSALAGYGINVTYVARTYDFQTYEASNFIKVFQGVLLERLQDTVGNLLMLFGYIEDKSFLSLRGVISLIAFALLGGILALTVRCGKLLKGMPGEGEAGQEGLAPQRFLLRFFIVAFALNTFVFVFVTGTIVSRYYITVFLFAAPLLAVYFQRETLPLDRILTALFLCVCLGLATAKCVYSFVDKDKNAQEREVARFLQQEGYTFGYATYWNGNIMTELTDGQVEVANIHHLEDLSFFRWSSPKFYYGEEYHRGKVFVLLTAQEAAESGELPWCQAGETVYQDGSYVVLHYESREELFE